MTLSPELGRSVFDAGLHFSLEDCWIETKGFVYSVRGIGLVAPFRFPLVANGS